MKKFDIRICKKETIQLNKPIIFLNYHSKDEAFAIPLKDIIEREGIRFVAGVNTPACREKYGETFSGCDILLSIVTDDFTQDKNCRSALEAAQQCGMRRVSILFTENDSWKMELGDLLGEIISFSSIQEEIDEYLMSALYYEEPFRTYFGKIDNKFCSVIRSVLHGSIIPPDLKIGNADSVILAVGSMGYSTLKLWMDQGFEIKSKAVLVYKNRDVDRGQPYIGNDIEKWQINIENEDKERGSVFLESLKTSVCEWLQKNVGSNKKLILMGGLGKTTSSFLLPFILNQANQLAIDICVICTLPFSFETKDVHRIARRSFEIIKRISKNTIYYDNADGGRLSVEPIMKMQDMFNLIGYAIAVAVNTGLDIKMNSTKRYNQQILITQCGGGTDFSKKVKQGTYGRFEVSIV